MDIKEIEIPVFLHPHLFWIFWRKDTKRRLQLQNDIAKEYSGRSKLKDDDFNVGEAIVMRKNLIWKRGIIEDIRESSTYKYEVWLMDYGHLEHTNEVYKLNSKFNLIEQPALVHQASLWNVVFLNEDLNVENHSIDQHRNTLPNAGATLIAREFLNDYQLFFKKSKDVDGILFGDIFYKKEGETSSLTQVLIKKNLMVEDEVLFCKIETSRIDNKIHHLQALRQASKKHEDARFSVDLSFLMDEVFMRNASRGISLTSDCETQSESKQNSVKSMSKSELLKKMRRKSELKKKEMLSCTESEREDTLPENIRFKSTQSSNEAASNFKNLLNRKKSAIPVDRKSGTEEPTSGSEANISVNKTSNSSLVSKLAALKLRSEKNKQKENLDIKESDSEKRVFSGEPKLLKSESGCTFIPGGLRVQPKRKKPISSNSENEQIIRKSPDTYRQKDTRENSINNHPQYAERRFIRKYVPKADSSWSNTSDASDVDIIKNWKHRMSSMDDNTSEMDNDKESNKIDKKKEFSYVDNTAKPKDTVPEISGNIVLEEKKEQTENQDVKVQIGEVYNDSAECTNAADSQMVVKPFCSCSQCHFWTTSETWEKGGENFTQEEICKRKKLRPPSLMLKEERKEVVKLASVDFRCMTKLEKDASFKILVHGRLIPQPVDFVVEAPFHSSIHRSLKRLKYYRTKKIQSYIWPSISRSMNVCYIHRKRSGKTLGYLPAICSFLLERDERYSDLKKGGPIAIVLGKTSTQCEEIYDLTNRLLEGVGYKKPKVLLVTYPFQYVNMSTVDMLITIPPILIELLKKNATNLKRLCHLVMESSDVLLEKYSEETKSVIGSVESMLLQRTTRQNVQMIISGEHWTLKLEKFLMVIRDVPLISIGDYLEAAVYGGIKLKVKLLAAKAKCDAVVDILRDKWKFHKSVILCDRNEEIELIKTALDLASISYIAITDDLTKDQACQKESNWDTQRGGEYIVLICTDEVLHTMLSITSASLLIHYSLPSKWSFWIKRFYCLLENYKSPLTRNNDKLKCEGYILTDELCVDQIPRLLSLLKNYNVSLQQFEPVCKQIETEKEEVKINNEIPLCSSLKKFGYCNFDNCPERHLFDVDLDNKTSLPQNGTIKYKITKLIDVNHVKVNIVEHKDIDGKIIDYKSQKDQNDEKLTSILNQKREKADILEEQSCYAYWDDGDFNDMFRECIVEKINSDVVDIILKSSGKKTRVSKSKIFKLPEGFNQDNTTDSCSAEIIIANFKPPYKDDQFSARAYFQLNNFIQDVGFNDSVFVSNICLQLGNTIWVNTIREEVIVYDVDLTKTDLNKELVKRKLAEPNQDHIDNLYALCEEAGIVLPRYNMPIQEQLRREPPQAEAQWAFLEHDECNKVYFCSAVTPDEIYMRLEKFDSVLYNLEKDLIEVVARAGSKQDFAIIEGRYYLAKDRTEEKYNRVLIKKIEEGKALCFCVDYGDEFIAPIEDIRYLSNYMIQRLPFQAIHCRLYGLTSIEGEWPPETVDVLYNNFTFETDSDIYRTLYAKCIIVERGQRKGQPLFSISLKDEYEKPLLINQLLIDCGWAALIDGAELIDFEVPYVTYQNEEDDISESEIDEVEKVKQIIDASNSAASNQIVPSYNPMDNRVNIDEDELEFFCGNSGDEIDTFIDFITALNNTSTEMQVKTTNTPKNLPAIEAAPFEVDYLTPDVYWSQTKKFIELYIKLPNVKTYNVKLLKSRILNFETTIEEKKYVVNLVLLEAVEKDFRHTLGGLDVKITLKKKKEEEWFKLARSKQRLRNVHYILREDEMDDDKNDKLFLDFGEDMDYGTENESDGAIFDVFTDEDSEYEQELQELDNF